MRKPWVTMGRVGLLVAVGLGACAPTTQTTPPPQPHNAGGLRPCPPIFQLASIRPLICQVNSNHQLEVAITRPPVIPSGTVVSYVAKLFNAGNCADPRLYCGSVTLRDPILPHLYTTITGQPALDDQSPCQAWAKDEPVVTQ
jgi:hypothetical protein